MPTESNCLCNCTLGKGRGLDSSFDLPSSCMDNIVSAPVVFVTSFYNLPDSPLATVHGGGQGEQVEECAGSEELS